MNDKPVFKLPEIPTITIDQMQDIRKAADWTNQLRGLQDSMQGIRNFFANDLNRITKAIGGLVASWQPLVQQLVKDSEAKKVLRENGLLPHRTTPWEQFDSENPAAFPAAVRAFYNQSWDEVRAAFLADIDGYNIGEETKQAFKEAIECHSAGLYRSAILTLLPAAEMEFRRTYAIEPGKGAASLKELRKAFDILPAGVVLSHFAPIDLFDTLDAHMYEEVKSEAALQKFMADEVPNRHAAIHGLIHYKTEISSINALIMTDYVCFLISQVSEYLEAAE